MKLLKKLLPLVSTVSIAAIVTPIVTSCGSRTFKYKWDEANPFVEFEPKNCISADEELELSNPDCTARYFQDVKKNKQILAEDIVYEIGHSLMRSNDSIISGDAEVKIGNIEPETGKISWSINYTLVSDDEIIARASAEVKNLEYVLTWANAYDDINMWFMAPLVYMYAGGASIDPIAYLRSRHDWSVKIGLWLGNKDPKKKISNAYSSIDVDLVNLFFDYKSPTESLEELLGISIDQNARALMSYISFDFLYYLQNVANEW